MKNEVLCKVLAHNACCVIMSQLELGVKPVFWGGEEAGMNQTCCPSRRREERLPGGL